MEILINNIYEILLLIAGVLILVDVFLTYELPTHVAYVLLTVFLIIKIERSIITSIFLSVFIWFGFIVFHYTVWRKLLEKFHDNIVSPRKHTGGIEGLIGKEGVVKEIEGSQFIQIDKELYQFECERSVVVGDTYKVEKINSNKLLI